MNKLSPSQIFSKTIGYVFGRMAVPLASALFSAITMIIVTKIMVNDEKPRLGIVGILIWAVITALVSVGLEFFVGYKYHAGQMAIITDAVSVNMIPDKMGELAKESTQYRFPSGNEYFSYRNSVRGAIMQLQYQLNTFAENRLRVPVLGQLIRICQFFIGHALSFAYDLVLCYTFWRDGKTLYASAADGIAVYWDSWKRMMRSIMIVAIMIIVGMATGFAFVFVIIAGLFSPSAGPVAGGLVGIAVAALVCRAAKIFIDTNLTIRSLDAYFEEAQYADYNSEQYENMCQYSKKYDKLYRKAVNEAFSPAPDAPGGGYVDDFSNMKP